MRSQETAVAAIIAVAVTGGLALCTIGPVVWYFWQEPSVTVLIWFAVIATVAAAIGAVTGSLGPSE